MSGLFFVPYVKSRASMSGFSLVLCLPLLILFLHLEPHFQDYYLTLFVAHFLPYFLSVPLFSPSSSSSPTDVHGQHPRGGQPLPYVWYLWAGYGEEIWGTNIGHVTPVSIIIVVIVIYLYLLFIYVFLSSCWYLPTVSYLSIIIITVIIVILVIVIHSFVISLYV